MGMKDTVKSILNDSLRIKEGFLKGEANIEAVTSAAEAIINCYENGGKVLAFGNGGSAADSQHLAAELLIRFEKERKSLPCIALTTDTSIITAASNDYDFSKVFSRQVEGLAAPSDVIFAISTSGNSENVLEGIKAAKEKGITVIALLGRDGGKIAKEVDIPIVVAGKNTARIQEVHVTVIHIICKLVEDALA